MQFLCVCNAAKCIKQMFEEQAGWTFTGTWQNDTGLLTETIRRRHSICLQPILCHTNIYQSGLLAVDRILCVLQVLRDTKLVICHCGVMLVMDSVWGALILQGQHCFWQNSKHIVPFWFRSAEITRQSCRVKKKGAALFVILGYRLSAVEVMDCLRSLWLVVTCLISLFTCRFRLLHRFKTRELVHSCFQLVYQVWSRTVVFAIF
jgi:hypothetical protein